MLTHSGYATTTPVDVSSHSQQPQSPASPHPSPSPLIHPHDHTKNASYCQVNNAPSPPSQESQKPTMQSISQSPQTLYHQLPASTSESTLSSYHHLGQQPDERTSWHYWHHLTSSYVKKPSFNLTHVELLDTLGETILLHSRMRPVGAEC